MADSANVSLGQVIEEALEAHSKSMAVSLPGTVVSYSASNRTATVRPGVHRLVPTLEDPDVDEAEALPAIQGVPVAWPQGRGYKLEGTLLPGDPVLLIACDRDISGWLRSGQPSEPDDAREHSWNSCVAIPGLTASGSFTPAPTDAAALASVVDALLRVLAAWVPVVSPPDGGASLKALFSAAFPGIPATPPAPVLAVTSGSTVLKLGS